jgi:tetratricopeptide (TPR) repeat protein
VPLLLAETHGSPYKRKGRLSLPWVYQIVSHPRVFDAVEGAIGPNLLVLGSDWFVKFPGDAAFISWHQDGGLLGLAAAQSDHRMDSPLSQVFDTTLIQDVYVPLAKAFVALAEGRPEEAVATAKPSRPYDSLYPGSYVQGLAYLQLHDAGQAVSAFQSAIKLKGGTLTQGASWPTYAQAQLGLARAYAMGGDKANAKKAYQDFFATWKDADADLPMLVAAKKEFAAL